MNLPEGTRLDLAVRQDFYDPATGAFPPPPEEGGVCLQFFEVAVAPGLVRPMVDQAGIDREAAGEESGDQGKVEQGQSLRQAAATYSDGKQATTGVQIGPCGSSTGLYFGYFGGKEHIPHPWLSSSSENLTYSLATNGAEIGVGDTDSHGDLVEGWAGISTTSRTTVAYKNVAFPDGKTHKVTIRFTDTIEGRFADFVFVGAGLTNDFTVWEDESLMTNGTPNRGSRIPSTDDSLIFFVRVGGGGHEEVVGSWSFSGHLAQMMGGYMALLTAKGDDTASRISNVSTMSEDWKKWLPQAAMFGALRGRRIAQSNFEIKSRTGEYKDRGLWYLPLVSGALNLAAAGVGLGVGASRNNSDAMSAGSAGVAELPGYAVSILKPEWYEGWRGHLWELGSAVAVGLGFGIAYSRAEKGAPEGLQTMGADGTVTGPDPIDPSSADSRFAGLQIDLGKIAYHAALLGRGAAQTLLDARLADYARIYARHDDKSVKRMEIDGEGLDHSRVLSVKVKTGSNETELMDTDYTAEVRYGRLVALDFRTGTVPVGASVAVTVIKNGFWDAIAPETTKVYVIPDPTAAPTGTTPPVIPIGRPPSGPSGPTPPVSGPPKPAPQVTAEPIRSQFYSSDVHLSSFTMSPSSGDFPLGSKAGNVTVSVDGIYMRVDQVSIIPEKPIGAGLRDLRFVFVDRVAQRGARIEVRFDVEGHEPVRWEWNVPEVEPQVSPAATEFRWNNGRVSSVVVRGTNLLGAVSRGIRVTRGGTALRTVGAINASTVKDGSFEIQFTGELPQTGDTISFDLLTAKHRGSAVSLSLGEIPTAPGNTTLGDLVYEEIGWEAAGLKKMVIGGTNLKIGDESLVSVKVNGIEVVQRCAVDIQSGRLTITLPSRILSGISIQVIYETGGVRVDKTYAVPKAPPVVTSLYADAWVTPGSVAKVDSFLLLGQGFGGVALTQVTIAGTTYYESSRDFTLETASGALTGIRVNLKSGLTIGPDEPVTFKFDVGGYQVDVIPGTTSARPLLNDRLEYRELGWDGTSLKKIVIGGTNLRAGEERIVSVRVDGSEVISQTTQRIENDWFSILLPHGVYPGSKVKIVYASSGNRIEQTYSIPRPPPVIRELTADIWLVDSSKTESKFRLEGIGFQGTTLQEIMIGRYRYRQDRGEFTATVANDGVLQIELLGDTKIGQGDVVTCTFDVGGYQTIVGPVSGAATLL